MRYQGTTRHNYCAKHDLTEPNCIFCNDYKPPKTQSLRICRHLKFDLSNHEIAGIRRGMFNYLNRDNAIITLSSERDVAARTKP